MTVVAQYLEIVKLVILPVTVYMVNSKNRLTQDGVRYTPSTNSALIASQFNQIISGPLGKRPGFVLDKR